MTKTLRLILFLAFVLFIGVGTGLSIWSYNNDKEADKNPAVKSSAFSAKLTTYVTYQGEEGKTALELLKKHAKTETETSSLGDYVVSINGNDGGGTKYWLYYVNGQQANIGAGAYITKNNDNIEWKLE